jgi:hypothetical protein
VGDGEKLLTYLNSALKVLSGLDIFPRGTKKELTFVDQCIYKKHWIVGGGLSSYELLFVFVLFKVLANLLSDAFQFHKVNDFNSSIVYILVLVTTMYLAFHLCSFTLLLSYSLWLNSNMASS